MQAIVFLYNLFQILTWGALLVSLLYYQVNLTKEEFLCLYHDNKEWKLLLEVAQGSAIFDMVFALLRWTPNSPGTVIPQIMSRLYVLWMVFPNVPRPTEGAQSLADYYIIHVAVGAWAQAEVIRFTFYSFKELQGVIGHLRYNVFLLMYPVGVGGELFCMWAARCAILSIEAESERPWTMLMPNQWNWHFRFEWSVYITYLMYTVGFPQLYFYMLHQRKRFYSKKPAATTTATEKKQN